VLLVAIVAGPFAFWRMRRNASTRDENLGLGGTGYQSQPWREGNGLGANPNASDVNLEQMNYPPQRFGQQEPPPRY
jgi:hypothetical protein